MELWIGTGNDHKLSEFKTLLHKLNLSIKSQKELPTFFSPPETGKTFADNARIKARALAAVQSDSWVMAEDSGLVVEGLAGSPGVYSARYAGEMATDVENNLKVLQMMRIRSPVNRQASFVSVIIVRSPEKEEFVFEGSLKGKISETMKGTDGFGYDSIFIPEGETKTIGELGQAHKNRISHRARAIDAMIVALGTRWS
jgi:non-canonical purine NTP pyrophosphatase (RdgB/HAM1 family)